MGRTPRVAITTLGCKVNQAESDAIAAALAESGALVAQTARADVIVINTCTVTAEADRKARKAIRSALGMPHAPAVVVTGCLAAVDPAGVAALGGRVVVEADKDRVAIHAGSLLPGARRVGVAIQGGLAPGTREFIDAPPHVAAGGSFTLAGRPRRMRAQVKVQDGCDTCCSYCIVPAARGRPRSVSLSAVVGAVRELVAEGVAEVVLTGVNIGRYDDSGIRLPGLVEAVAGAGVRRVRLSSIEPGDVTAELLAVAATTPSFCRHLHVPLQSGADRTLRAMGRPYDTEAFAAVLASARMALPGVAITTDVITGFPGESEDDHLSSLAFVQACGFSRLHVFRYSARPGTPAAVLPHQIPSRVRATRASAMRALGDDLAAQHAAGAVGTRAEVLIERVRPASRGVPPVAEGVTREYLRVRVQAFGVVPGDVLEAVIVSAEGGTAVARLTA